MNYPEKINPWRQQSGGCQGLRGGGPGETMLEGLLLWSDGNALETDRGGGCPTLNAQKATEPFTG